MNFIWKNHQCLIEYLPAIANHFYPTNAIIRDSIVTSLADKRRENKIAHLLRVNDNLQDMSPDRLHENY
jgi:hypothetical protein